MCNKRASNLQYVRRLVQIYTENRVMLEVIARREKRDRRITWAPLTLHRDILVIPSPSITYTDVRDPAAQPFPLFYA